VHAKRYKAISDLLHAHILGIFKTMSKNNHNHMKPLLLLIPLSFLSLNSCIVVDETGNTATKPSKQTKPTQISTPSTKNTVPKKVTDDCLAALRKQVGDQSMTIINARQGETSFIVDIKVAGAEKPWRCYHDGTQCTSTVYQGEG
jgi:hypothetical protein